MRPLYVLLQFVEASPSTIYFVILVFMSKQECIHAEGVKISNQDKRYSNKYFGNLLKKTVIPLFLSLSLDCNINPEYGDDDILQCLQNGKRTAGFKGH